MSNLYILNTLSNMHVGSGDMNFGIVENQVQRDAITTYPTIHSSSLKGCIRRHLEELVENDELISYIFGKSSGDEKMSQSGKFRFFGANLLVLPVRSNKVPFYRATSPEIIKQLLSTIESFNVSVKEELLDALKELYSRVKNTSKCLILVRKKSGNNAKIKVEDYLAEEMEFEALPILESLFGENLCILFEEALNITANELPVIARNCLENGISKNLWYEEIVPRETRFYFTITEGQKYNEYFDEVLTGNILQVGANASIGYGYAKVTNICKIGG